MPNETERKIIPELTILSTESLSFTETQSILRIMVSQNGNEPFPYYTLQGITCPNKPKEEEIARDLNKLMSQKNEFRQQDEKMQEYTWGQSTELAALLCSPDRDRHKINTIVRSDFSVLITQNALGIIFCRETYPQQAQV